MNVEEHFYYLNRKSQKAFHVLRHVFGQIRVPFREYRLGFTFVDTFFTDFVSLFVNMNSKVQKRGRSLVNSSLY